MLLPRIFTAAVGGAAFVFTARLGGSAWLALWIILSLLAVKEYAAMLRMRGHNPWQSGLAAGIGMMYLGSVLGWLGDDVGFTLAIGMAFLILAAYPSVSGKYTFLDGVFTAHGLLYIGWQSAVFIRLRGLGPGPVLMVFLIIWASDSLAYLGGRFLGRTRLAPKVSPNKTVEGALAGLAGGVAVAAMAGPALLAGTPADGLGLAALAAVGALLSAAGQVGDLYESALKRYCGVKDSGVILPGHGGILDRFDSALFAGPTAYWLLKLVILK